MRNDTMAKAFLTWGYSRTEAEEKARALAQDSGNQFYSQVADSIRANGQNRRKRRADKQRRAETSDAS